MAAMYASKTWPLVARFARRRVPNGIMIIVYNTFMSERSHFLNPEGLHAAHTMHWRRTHPEPLEEDLLRKIATAETAVEILCALCDDIDSRRSKTGPTVSFPISALLRDVGPLHPDPLKKVLEALIDEIDYREDATSLLEALVAHLPEAGFRTPKS